MLHIFKWLQHTIGSKLPKLSSWNENLTFALDELLHSSENYLLKVLPSWISGTRYNFRQRNTFKGTTIKSQ